jgi:hypothetical protein
VRLDLVAQGKDHGLEIIMDDSAGYWLSFCSWPFQAIFRILPNLSEEIIIVLPSGFFARLPSSIRVKGVHRVWFVARSSFKMDWWQWQKNFLILHVSPASSMYLFSDTASSPSGVLP